MFFRVFIQWRTAWAVSFLQSSSGWETAISEHLNYASLDMSYLPEWPYCIFLWTYPSALGESEGRRHIWQLFVFRYPGILSQSLLSDVGELVYSKERLSGKSWKISLTHDLIWVLSAEWVSVSPWPDRTQDAYFPPQGSWPELKPPPKSEWNF